MSDTNVFTIHGGMNIYRENIYRIIIDDKETDLIAAPSHDGDGVQNAMEKYCGLHPDADRTKIRVEDLGDVLDWLRNGYYRDAATATGMYDGW